MDDSKELRKRLKEIGVIAEPMEEKEMADHFRLSISASIKGTRCETSVKVSKELYRNEKLYKRTYLEEGLLKSLFLLINKDKED